LGLLDNKIFKKKKEKKRKEKCKIGFCDWANLQITTSGITINSEVHVVDEIDKSLHEVKFRKKIDRFR